MSSDDDYPIQKRLTENADRLERLLEDDDAPMNKGDTAYRFIEELAEAWADEPTFMVWLEAFFQNEGLREEWRERAQDALDDLRKEEPQG